MARAAEAGCPEAMLPLLFGRDLTWLSDARASVGAPRPRGFTRTADTLVSVRAPAPGGGAAPMRHVPDPCSHTPRRSAQSARSAWLVCGAARPARETSGMQSASRVRVGVLAPPSRSPGSRPLETLETLADARLRFRDAGVEGRSAVEPKVSDRSDAADLRSIPPCGRNN